MPKTAVYIIVNKFAKQFFLNVWNTGGSTYQMNSGWIPESSSLIGAFGQITEPQVALWCV